MQCATIMVGMLALAAAAPVPGVVLLPPRSRAGFELTVQHWGASRVERIARPGAHEFELKCSHEAGKTEGLTVEVVQRAEWPGRKGQWRQCTPDEVRQMARDGAQEAVRFLDAFGTAAQWPEDAALLPGGWSRSGFRTATGVLCLLPEGRPDVRDIVQAASPGGEMAVWGRPLPLGADDVAVLVEQVEPHKDAAEAPILSWDVTVRWAGGEAARFGAPGLYPVNLPCAFREGAVERVAFRLTHIRRVDLAVKGHRVDAELADTPVKRSWGLQGRDSLGQDEGMLFFFERAERPYFTMKTVSFPLSIAFIRADGTVVSIAQLNPGEARMVSPPAPVNYVLEMAQGWFAGHGIAPGDRVEIP